jgi:WD40 repeat protein
MSICLDELCRCQKVTPRPNFIALLGDRYGWRPLPSHIQALEFDGLLAAMSDAEKQEVRSWYWRDDNAVPSDYVLQPRTGVFDDATRWQEEEAGLRAILVGAAGRVLAPDDPRRAKYYDSATHQEIRQGALQAKDSDNNVFCYLREFRRKPGPKAPGADQFIDLMANVHSSGQRSVDAVAQATLQKLKEDLATRFGPRHVYRYSLSQFDRLLDEDFAPEKEKEILDLSDRVERDLRGIIELELDRFDRDTTAQPDPEVAAQEGFANRWRTDFVGREGLLGRIATYLAGQNSRPFVVCGPSGCGKTALMAEAAHRARSRVGDAAEPLVLFRAIGATPNSSDIRSLLESVCCEIDRDWGAASNPSPIDPRDVMEAFRSRLSSATPDRPLIVFLDAIDQLGSADGARQLAWVPRRLSPHAKLVLSVLNADGAPDGCYQASQGIAGPENLVPVALLTPMEGEALLDAWLATAGRRLEPAEAPASATDQEGERRGGRRLSNAQRDEVLKKFNGSGEGLPLYLRLAFEEARRWESYAEPLDTVLAPTTSTLIHSLLESLRQNHKLLVDYALGYLAAGRNGLTEDELIDVLSADNEFFQKFLERSHHSPPERRLPTVVWARLHADLAFYLAERHADHTTVLSFYHRQIADVLAERLLRDDHGERLHRRLASYFGGHTHMASQPHEFIGPDGDRIPNCRKLSELPYQLRHGHLDDELERTLTDLGFLDAKCRAGMLFDTLCDCRLATARGGLPAIRQVQQALGIAVPSLLLHPEIAGQQTFNRLRWLDGCERILVSDFERMVEYLDGRGHWLQAEGPVSKTQTERGLVLPLRSPTLLQAVSPNGRLFAAFYPDGELEIRDLTSGEHVDRRRIDAQRPVAIAVGEDVASFAFMEYGGRVRSPWAEASLSVRARESRLVCHSAHGVITVRPDHALVAWNPPRDSVTVLTKDLSAPLRILRAVPDGHHVLFVAGDGPQEIGVSALTGGGWETRLLPYAGPAIMDASIDAEGRLVLLACRDRCLRILDATNGATRVEELAYEAYPQVAVRGAPERCAMGFGNSSGKAFLATRDGHVACWNWREGTLERWEGFRSLTETADLVVFEVMPPEGRLLLSTERAGRTRSAREFASVGDRHPVTVSSVLLMPDGKVLSACRHDWTLRWFSADGLCPLGVRVLPSLPPVCLTGLPDTDAVLVGSDQGYVTRVERQEVQLQPQILANLADPVVSLFTSAGHAVAASHTGKIVRFPLDDPEIHVLRLATGFLIQKKVLPAGEHGLCWSVHRDVHSPNEVCLVSLVRDAGQEEVVFSTPGDVRDAAVTRDGSTLCLAGNQVNLLRRTRMGWKPVAARSTHVQCVTFLGDDRFLAAARCDAPWLEIWDAERDLATVAIVDLSSYASCLASREDRIVVGFRSGTLMSWKLRGMPLPGSHHK